MRKRLVWQFSWIGAALLAWQVAVAPVFAGGWSTVTLDSTPANIQPGVPFPIGFMVRQHGQTPLAGLKPVVRLTSVGPKDAGKLVQVDAKDEGEAGHYAAQITLPNAGEWTWLIDVFEGPHELTPIQVGAAAPAAAKPAPASAVPWIVLVGGLAVVALGAGGGLVFALARRPRPAFRDSGPLAESK